MTNAIVLIIVIAAFASAVYYIIRAKKKGQACIGCPSSGTCTKCHCNDAANPR